MDNKKPMILDSKILEMLNDLGYVGDEVQAMLLGKSGKYKDRPRMDTLW